MSNYDVAVIGAGPGGYVAAIRAAQLGLKTAVIEREHLGGICLNWGCIPTKALLRSAEVYHLMNNADEFGIKCSNVEIDFTKIVKRSRQVSEQLSKGIKGLLKKNKIDVVYGEASFLNKEQLKVSSSTGQSTIEAKNIIIATGARPKSLPGLEADGKLIWNYKDAMVPTEMPKSLLVIGSGAIGIEFASFYSTLGTNVTVVEIADNILNAEDCEISEFMHKSLEAKGIKIHTKTRVENINKGNGQATAKLVKNDGSTITVKADKIISAVGVQANIERLNLEGVGVTCKDGYITTNVFMQTSQPNIYAIGDVTSPPWLAHKASHEGVLCAEKIAGVENLKPINANNIPGCTYSNPQVASIGLTEKQAKEEGYELKVGRFPFIGNGKALALGEPEGLVKTIFDAKTGELLGAHMVGAEVTELIQGFVSVKAMEGTELDIMHTIYPHPTLSEMMHESVLAAYNKAIHI